MSDSFFVASVTTYALVGAFALISIFVVIWRLTTSWHRSLVGIAVVLVVALALSLGTPLLLLF